MKNAEGGRNGRTGRQNVNGEANSPHPTIPYPLHHPKLKNLLLRIIC